MKVERQDTRTIKPSYEEGTIPPPTTDSIPLNVFDKASFNTHVAILYAYRPPTPPTATLLLGLSKVLSAYRKFAGRLSNDADGEPVILLNDEGVKFVEASVDGTLDQAMPFKPSPALLDLHPALDGVPELAQVQITRFTCGSMVVGFTSNHLIADGFATSNFLVAWGKACRGLDMGLLPIDDHPGLSPRDPPLFEFEHRGVEYKNHSQQKPTSNAILEQNSDVAADDVMVHKAHFTVEFLSKLKAKASSNSSKPYTTLVSLVAHLWRSITRARGLAGHEKTYVRIAVNGRMRMSPRIPNEYFGNVVLWAFPTAKVRDLLREPLSYAAKLIQDAITGVDDRYFRSFIDFANHKVKQEGLVPTADAGETVLCPNLEIDSWLRFPFYDLDFGGGCPYIFMPSYLPIEGLLILLPSFIGDGSVDAFLPLLRDNLSTFKDFCYSLNH